MDTQTSQALKDCQDIQHMIDITSQHLDRLRSTFSNASDELTRQEIRTLEGKLVKHFSEQLAVKYGLGANNSDFVYFPSLSQWLQVVGVSCDTKDAICQRVRSLEDLKDKTECELKRILLTASRVPPNVRHEDLRRLCRSLHNLRKYTDVLVYGGKMYGPGGDPSKLELYWDSWDMPHSKSECSSPKNSFTLPNRLVHISTDDLPISSPLPFSRSHQNRPADSTSSSVSSSSSAPPPSPGCSTLSPPSITESLSRGSMITPPATPPWVVLTKEKGRGAPHSTPPASKKLSTSSHGVRDLSALSKSKSQESELSNRIDNFIVETQTEGRLEPGERIDSSGYSSASEAPSSSRRRLPSSDPEGSQSDCQGPSPVSSPKSPAVLKSSLQVPRSPRTPGVMVPPANRPMTHIINHRFTKTFKPARCMYCQEIFFQGMKCKECKFRCHTLCQSLVPPSCGLPDDLLQHFMHHLTSEGSPILPRSQPTSLVQPPFHSSSSSCNSSTPSSPQVIVTSHPTPPWVVRSGQHFHFPDPSNPRQFSSPVQVVESVGSANPLVDTVKSNDSDKTLSGSSDSIGTAYRLDSQDSTTSVEGDAASTWSSGRQMSIREWDIPYEELKIMDKIGSGRFSTVHMGNWHGDVAIKVLDVENLEDETAALEAFKLDVATFRKTRHENLVLFMGACMKPPKLAIVTSLCKGNTLYTHLHLRKDKFFMNKIIIIAQQIALGMGYLHHRGIVHKDLKTKNIFLENSRAIIADFGLVNVARRLCSRYRRPGDSRGGISECMSIPAGWLCYLAPEVIRELRVHQTRGEDLPFTRSSDVYAFGTVWYELLTGEWPWKHRPPESIIWQVGHGIKPTLANLQASREVKDILVQCWLFNPERRPDFSDIVQSLEKLPKKRLARSPSHPIHLSRSAESVF
ncbi:kinase suppressor of Ras 2 [Eurytemora carolleeae]|uniref:kinase suppressor of Ras 2 n=1 Tax=Eurytemora carolleeae TaxID=1294199 RepID=UPI000C77B142|nr:kinase suppressor of Ras 2 [Eurytemora carolleeae]XP_023345246.1 kinase suppressor of Ras 2 [Eurytemora carolleeae]XP_023345248.1 kinase suppressor of Ras 2 [Eurytemora carolleeae]XP_023345249.1 kinase suppressor of Ras 2 [Eurytemora carolleeae]|eukprot:XP_023345245.1 kinase suppressor of Ras 2-like [Eurytemora affinis]